MLREPDTELPMKGLFALQAQLLVFAVMVPLLAWLAAWLAPLPALPRLIALIVPPMIASGGIVFITFIRCPACTKMLMIKGLTIIPRHKCPHCRQVVA